LKSAFWSILTKKPYNLLWIAAILTFATGLLAGNDAFDITRGDSYYVYSYTLIYGSIAILLIAFWIIYLIADRRLLSARLSWLHILATVLAIFMFFNLSKFALGLPGVPRRYYAISEFPKPDYRWLAPVLAMILAFAIGQLCFLVNLFGGILRYVWRSSHRGQSLK